MVPWRLVTAEIARQPGQGQVTVDPVKIISHQFWSSANLVAVRHVTHSLAYIGMTNSNRTPWSTWLCPSPHVLLRRIIWSFYIRRYDTVWYRTIKWAYVWRAVRKKTYRVLLLKVIQGHRNRHGSIGYLSDA